MSLNLSYAISTPSLPKTLHLPLNSRPRSALHFLYPCLRSPTMSLTLPHAVRPVTIPFSDIQDKSADLSAKIEEGFGPNGLGIIAVSNVPGYSSLRQSLLHLSPRLAKLPEEEKKKLEDPHSRYNFGWSHGKEKLESGKPDILKGSFYANPILDVPTEDEALIHRYPSYCGWNIWPHNALPELEVAFKAIGRMMLDVGVMVAYHCDRYVSEGMNVGADKGLEHIICRSRCHKGRLLYYFPAQESDSLKSDWMSSWCGWHTDHGSLTGLTCGMFLKDDVQVTCPDTAAGLYVKTRNDQIVKVVYGENEIAYQIGETTEILSGGYLHATPHCVRVLMLFLCFLSASSWFVSYFHVTCYKLSKVKFHFQAPSGKDISGLERSTFALFMQPDWDEVLNFPENVPIHKELIPPKSSLTFGEYTEKLLDKYYHLKS